MKRLLLIALWEICLVAGAQHREIDSLNGVLGALSDTTRIDCLNALSCQYALADQKDSAESYTRMARRLAQKQGYRHDLA